MIQSYVRDQQSEAIEVISKIEITRASLKSTQDRVKGGVKKFKLSLARNVRKLDKVVHEVNETVDTSCSALDEHQSRLTESTVEQQTLLALAESPGP